MGFCFRERMSGSAQPSAGGDSLPFAFSLVIRCSQLLLPWRTVYGEIHATVELDSVASGVPGRGWIELSPFRRRMMRYVIDFVADDGRSCRFDGRKRIRPWWLPSWTVLRGPLTVDGVVWAQAELRFSLRRQLVGLLASMRPWRDPGPGVTAEELMAPRWRGQCGRLEVWYATVTDPRSGTGLWIHHELLAARDAPTVRRQGWAAVFPPQDEPLVSHFGGDPSESAGPGPGLPVFAASGAMIRGGQLSGASDPVRWDLRYREQGRPLFTFPEWAWTRELLPAAQVVPAPTARFDGTVQVGARTIELHDAPGAVARIYGQGNAERWGWLHADLGDGDVLEIVSAVSRRAILRRLAPMSFLVLRVGGRDWPRRRLLAAFVLRCRLDPPHGFTVGGTLGRQRLRADVRLDPERTLTLDYDDTEGSGPRCANSELASLQLVIERRVGAGRWEVQRTWNLPHGVHAEVGWRA